MAFLEYGTLQGLARDFGYGERTQDLYNQEALLEKARDKAEAKAKLMTDDLDYILPMNEYDRPVADSFVKEQLKNIGLYYKNNPDVFTNVQKRIELNRMKKQLKEHPSIVNGIMNDIELKKWDDFVADPKNAALRESDDFKIASKQRENFLKNGNPDADIADGTYKNYKFRSPMENFDFAKYLKQEGAAIDYDREVIEDNDQFTRKFVSDAKITDVSKLLLDGKQKAKIDRIWEDLPKQEKEALIGDTDEAKKLNWFAKQLKLHVKGEEIKSTGYKKATRDYTQEAILKAQLKQYEIDSERERKSQEAQAKAQKEIDNNPILKQSIEMAQEMKDGKSVVSRPADIGYFAPFFDNKTSNYNITGAEIINPNTGNVYTANIPVYKKGDFLTTDMQYTCVYDPLTNRNRFYVTGMAKVPFDKVPLMFEGDNPIDNAQLWGFDDTIEDSWIGNKGPAFKILQQEITLKGQKGIAGIPFRVEISPADVKTANAINAKIKPIGKVATPSSVKQPTAEEIKQWDAKWKSLKPGQSLVGFDGKTYYK